MMTRAFRGSDAVPVGPQESGQETRNDAEDVATLTRAAVSRDPHALEVFLRAMSPVVRRTCRGALGPSHPDLEDTVQDCLMDIVRALPKYRFEGSPIHYVTKISLRRAIASRRRISRVQRLRLLEGWQEATSTPVRWGAAIEQTEIVRLLIRQLRRSQAEALLLRVVLGFSIEEIAAITEAPTNTVKTRLRLGKTALRELLDRHADDAPSPTGDEI